MVRVHLSGFPAPDRMDDPMAIRAIFAAAALRLQAALGPLVYLANLDDDAFLVVLTDASALDAATRNLTEPITLEHGEIRLQVRVEKIDNAAIETLARPAARI